MSRGLGALILICLTVILSTYIGATTLSRRQQFAQAIDAVCTTDKILVQTIDRGLKSTTLSEAVAQPDRYLKGYQLSVSFEKDLVAHAPCVITHKTPPNLLLK